MKLVLKPSALKVRHTDVKWLIIHHTSEIYPQPAAKIDNDNFQIPALYNGVLENKQADINYHYIIEKIKSDYHVMVCRPFTYICDWDDIDSNISTRAIHIALLGNYDMKIPPKRLYEVLAYRILNPLLKIFRISPDRIKLHRDVSNNPDLSCPGYFVERPEIITSTRRFVIK